MRKNHSLILGMSLLSAITSCAGREPERTPPPAPVVAAVEEVRRTPIPTTYEAVGTVRSRTASVLSSRLVARVTAVHVREGDLVKKDQLLIELDAGDVSAALRKAEAGLSLASATRTRYAALFERRSVARQELDEVEAKYRAAEADAAAARTAVSWSRIVSPIDGVVTAKSVEVGSMAAPGVPLLTVEDPSDLRLEAHLDESALSAARMGGAVDVSVAAADSEELSGRVSEIVPAADPASRSFLVKIDLPRNPALRSGMFGRARFAYGEARLLTVPKAALMERGPLTEVYAVDSRGMARLRLVKPGRHYGERVAILSGVDEGERIVTSDVERIRDGALVASAAGGEMP